MTARNARKVNCDDDDDDHDGVVLNCVTMKTIIVCFEKYIWQDRFLFQYIKTEIGFF